MGGKRKKFGIGEGGELETAGAMRWMLTYLDMVTLLFALFVILYSISAVDETKLRAMAMALGQAFGTAGQTSVLSSGATTDTKPVVMQNNQVQLTTTRQRVQKWMLQQKLEKDINVRFNERGLIISLMTDRVLFNPASAELMARTKRILTDLGEIMKETTNPIAVEGHTDDAPMTKTTGKYQDNWDLSAARAVNVVRYLLNRGIAPDRFSATGYADTKPLVPNIDEMTRTKNRRIDIVILKADLIGDKERQSREMPLPSDVKVKQKIDKENLKSITY